MVTATEWADYLNDPYNYMTMFNEYKRNDAGCPEGADYQVYTKDLIENYAQKNANDPIEYPDFDWKSAIIKNSAGAHSHNVTLLLSLRQQGRKDTGICGLPKHRCPLRRIQLREVQRSCKKQRQHHQEPQRRH